MVKTTQTSLFMNAAEVTFQSEGETLIGTLFLPTSYRQGDKLPAVIVGGSWITVKEQMASLYAERLAEQGFVALAFDFRTFGESSGEPRQYESGQYKTQDFKNALTFLQSQPMIDPNRIGGLAICASAGYMARAVAEDSRFQSFVSVAGWFQHPESTPAFYGGAEGVQRRVDLANAAMSQLQSGGQMDYVPAYDPKDENAAMFFEVDYYADPKRGAVPEWKNQFAVASWSQWLQFNAIDGIAEKITTSTLFIHSDNCVLPDNVRRFHGLIKGTKEMYWSSEGTQTDFYDQEPYVSKAVQIAAAHFKATLKDNSDDERIRRVVVQMAHAADAKDWETIRSIFGDEVDFDYTSVAGGPPAQFKADDIVIGWREGLGRYRETKHNFSDIAVKAEGDKAVCNFSGQATHLRDEDGTEVRWSCGGDYTYAFSRTAQGWKVTAAKFDMKWEQGTR